MASTEAFTVPLGLEKFSFTGVAEAGGEPDWQLQPAGSVIDTVNVFVFDKVDQKVGPITVIDFGDSVVDFGSVISNVQILLPWSKAGFGVGRLVPFVALLKPGDDPFEVAKEAVKVRSILFEYDPEHILSGLNRHKQAAA